MKMLMNAMYGWEIRKLSEVRIVKLHSVETKLLAAKFFCFTDIFNALKYVYTVVGRKIWQNFIGHEKKMQY